MGVCWDIGIHLHVLQLPAPCYAVTRVKWVVFMALPDAVLSGCWGVVTHFERSSGPI